MQNATAYMFEPVVDRKSAKRMTKYMIGRYLDDDRENCGDRSKTEPALTKRATLRYFSIHPDSLYVGHREHHEPDEQGSLPDEGF